MEEDLLEVILPLSAGSRRSNWRQRCAEQRHGACEKRRSRRCSQHASRERKADTGVTYVRGGGTIDACEIENWCREAEVCADPQSLPALLSKLNAHLALRTFLVGHRLSLADAVMWAQLHRAMTQPSTVHSAGRHVRRWISVLDESKPFKAAQHAVKAEEATGDKGQWAEVMRLVGSQGNFVKLEGATRGQVVTRFPPEPSGYLHIGHAKAALLNDYLARMYDGKLVVRFDDTNPAKESTEFEQSILRDLDGLGVHPDVVEYTSDYFERLQDVATEWIRRGVAYVDKTSVDEMRAQRLAREENEYRSASVDENLRLWEQMQQGSEEGLKCALRAKIDMNHKSGSMRDPTIYRCVVGVSHHRTGDRWKVYPGYDFACPIVDSLEGVTNALRSSEYVDRKIQYEWMCNTAGLRAPSMWEFSRLNFKYTVLSKRNLRWFVENDLVDGWNDPRFPTVQGIRRRGMTIAALRAFILSQGASRNSNLMEWDKIWTVNKRVIDPVAPRHTAIAAAPGARRTLIVRNAEKGVVVRGVPRHKKNPSLGEKIVLYSQRVLLEAVDANELKVDQIVTLMDWGNVRIVNTGGEQLEGEFLPDNTDFKRTVKLTWLSDVDQLVPAVLVKYGHLILKEKVDEGESIEDCANRNSKHEESVLCDVNVRQLQKSDIIQFERRGYFICDAVHVRDTGGGRPMTFIEIPDGRAAK